MGFSAAQAAGCLFVTGVVIFRKHTLPVAIYRDRRQWGTFLQILLPMLVCEFLAAFAVICPVKVENMILGGGVLRSGGKTQYVMLVDMTGTWLFGVPLGLLSAFVLKLPIGWVYFLLSLEELVRLLISLVIFRKKRWLQKL